MFASFRMFVTCVTATLLLGPTVLAQVRVTPKEAKGGEKQGEPWAEVPESFKRPENPGLAGADRPQALAGGRPRQDPRDLAPLPGRDAAPAGPAQGQGRVQGGARRLHPGAVRVPQRRGHGRARHPAHPQEPQGAGPGDHRLARARQLQGEHLHRCQEQSADRPDAGQARLRRGGHRRLLQRRTRRQGAGRPAAWTRAPTRRS